MRIAMLTSTLPRFSGDQQANFVAEQAQAWLAARPRDIIHILAPHHYGAARNESDGRLHIERFRYLTPERWQRLAYPAILPNIRRNKLLALQLPAFLLAEFLAAKRLVRRTDANCVYAHWVMPQGLVAWRLKQVMGVPYILQNHSSDLTAFARLGSAGREIARRVLRDAAHFFCVNEAQRRAALAFLPAVEQEEFASKCTVLPMGMSPPEAAVETADARFDIATIARLSRKKGLHYLIEAAENLAKRGVRPRIGIAGDGEDRLFLERMVRDADITFVGFLSGKEKENFLARSDRFAFPARASESDVEGLPVALLEALCRGRPVLASRDTNIEMLPEWPLVDREVIFVADPAEIKSLETAIERLLQIAPKVSETTARAMDRYRWNRLIEEYLAPIETALAR